VDNLVEADTYREIASAEQGCVLMTITQSKQSEDEGEGRMFESNLKQRASCSFDDGIALVYR
jgi:hypothetical protein